MASPAPSATAVTQPPIYFDEGWKLSKKEMLSSSRTKGIKSRKCSFTRRCARLVREQRARFYIMRRCVTMLVCWHNYGDS